MAPVPSRGKTLKTQRQQSIHSSTSAAPAGPSIGSNTVTKRHTSRSQQFVYSAIPSQPAAAVDHEHLTSLKSAAALSTMATSTYSQLTFAASSISAQASATTTNAATAAPMADSLPDIPSWAMHMFWSGLTFAFVVAIILYLVNFPAQLGSVKRLRARPFTRSRKHEGKEGIELNTYGLPPPHFTTSATSTAADSPVVDDRGAANMRQRGKAKNLSVDTTARYIGLGIAMQGQALEEAHLPRVSKTRQSIDSLLYGYDSEEDDASSHGSTVPLNKSWSALTAPLPAAKDIFRHVIRAPDADEAARSLRVRCPDVESGFATLKPVDKPSCYRHSPWPSPEPTPSESGTSSMSSSGILSKVGNGIEWSADKLAKMLHDQVRDDPEDGLLLPIRRDEREQMRSPGVHVC